MAISNIKEINENEDQLKTDITGLVEAKDIIIKKLDEIKEYLRCHDQEGHLTRVARVKEVEKYFGEVLGEIQEKIDQRLDKMLKIK